MLADKRRMPWPDTAVDVNGHILGFAMELKGGLSLHTPPLDYAPSAPRLTTPLDHASWPQPLTTPRDHTPVATITVHALSRSPQYNTVVFVRQVAFSSGQCGRKTSTGNGKAPLPSTLERHPRVSKP